jgi:photosystem II stability/assembly factor-like uncharacterized protein
MKKNFIFLALGFFLMFGILVAQKPAGYQSLSNEEQEELKDNPLRREQEFMKQRTYPSGEIPDNARQNAMVQSDRLKLTAKGQAAMLASQPVWHCVGPFTIGGRINSIAVNPQNSSIVFLCAASGGIWKSTNGGENWKPVFDNENSLSMGALSIDPNNPSIMYVGTGEAVTASYTFYLGNGVFKSTDEGETWKVIGLTNSGGFSKIIVDPVNSNNIFAGAVKRGQGFYKSTDAGQTWRLTFDKPITDISLNPNNHNEIFTGVSGEGVYISTDMGETWAMRSYGFNDVIGRVSVQIAKTNPNVLYCLMENDAIGEIYKTTDKGANWNLLSNGGSSFFNGQGWYDNYIVVDPTNENIAYAAGIDIWKTSNGGTNWNNLTYGYAGGSVHVDQHCMALDPQDPSKLYVGNDGGIYYSTDAGVNWVDKNNDLGITQLYGMAIDLTKANQNYAGAQDNGTLGSLNSSSWQGVVGGDGFRVIVDPNNSSILYGEYYNGNMFRVNVTTGAYQSIVNGLPVSSTDPWNAPMAYNQQATMLFHGRHAIFASYDNGSSWFAMSPTLASTYSTIATSELNPNIIYGGTDAGEVYGTTDFGTTWKDLSGNGLPNRWVTDIKISLYKENIVYLTVSGYGSAHVFKSTDYGSTWNDIGIGLPDIPCNTIALHPDDQQGNILFVGTDIGVFATFDGGQNWLPFGKDLSRAPVTDLVFHTNRVILPDLTLRAATYGRSIWEVPVGTEIINSAEITSPYGGELLTGGTPEGIYWYGFNLPVRVEYSLDDGIIWNILAENVNSNTVQWFLPNLTTITARVRVTSASDASQTKTTNTFTIMQMSTGAVLKQSNVNFIPYGIAWDGKTGLWTTDFQSNTLRRLNSETFVKEKEFKLDGDSLFSDIAMDRQNGILYIHRMNSTNGGGGKILVYDTTGNLINQFVSPAPSYPIGLDLLDGHLIVGDRDGQQMLYTINASTGTVLSQVKNPYNKTYGPRGLCSDQQKYLYQVCTYFPGGGSMTESQIIKIDKSNLSKSIDSMKLETINGLINGRGIDYDTRDNNFWITDYNGALYKIAGFNPLTAVEDETPVSTDDFQAVISPNPAADNAQLTFMTGGYDGRLQIKMIDMLGDIIGTVFDENVSGNTPQNLQIDCNRLASGMYSVIFITEGRIALSKKLAIVK